MNKFATITLPDQFIFEKVNFYTVIFENEISEADKFFEKLEMHADEKDALRFIAVLEEIGNIRGAKERYFRAERGFNALPPSNKEAIKMHLSQFELINDWRLYCLRLSDNIVILFNGDIKTARTAQQCPRVAPFFYQAGQLTKLIDEGIKDRDIVIIENKLVIHPKFELIL